MRNGSVGVGVGVGVLQCCLQVLCCKITIPMLYPNVGYTENPALIMTSLWLALHLPHCMQPTHSLPQQLLDGHR